MHARNIYGPMQQCSCLCYVIYELDWLLSGRRYLHEHSMTTGKRKEEREGKSRRKKKGVVSVVVNRGAWTAEEDRKLAEYVECHGEKNWRTLPAKAGLKRCGKSCRLRWLNYLRPGIKRGNITDEEEDLIIRLHNLLGNRWSLIAGRLPGRTDNEIKNHWNTHLSRRSMSIDDLNLKLNNQKVLSPRLDAPPDHLDLQQFELGGDEEQLFDLMMMSSHEISGLDYDLNYEFGWWMDEDIDLFGWPGTSYAQSAVW